MMQAYNCAYPYYTFLKYNEAPTFVDMMGGSKEPGCLVSDLMGFASPAAPVLMLPRQWRRAIAWALSPLQPARC